MPQVKAEKPLTKAQKEAIEEAPHLAKYIKEQGEGGASESNRIISKIKYDGTELEIKYIAQSGEKDTKETIFRSKEYPHIDFYNSLEELREEVVHMLELPEEYMDNMSVMGVSVGIGAVITAVKLFPELGNKALCLKTPHMVYEARAKEGVIPMPYRTEQAVKKLVSEAQAFMDGKRKNKQLSLVN